MNKKYKLIIIGIDQSYSRCGISIAADGNIIKADSIAFKANQASTVKRKLLERYLFKILSKASQIASRIAIIFERIRTFSSGNKIMPKYLISAGALAAVIIDAAYEFKIDVWSVDTRSWKTQIVGTNKAAAINKTHPSYKYARKLPTLRFVKSLGFDCKIGRDSKGRNIYDDDKADSICISLYGFLPKGKRKLKKES